jgi:ElaB/YqjD/DUF883 family membrane-anchored ribosome-binding protein
LLLAPPFGKSPCGTLDARAVPHLHRLWATVRGDGQAARAQLWLASTPEELDDVLRRWEAEAKDLPHDARAAVADAVTRVRAVLYDNPAGGGKAVLGPLGELADVRKAVADLDALLRKCGAKPTTLAPELRKKLKEAVQLTRKEKGELNARLKELDAHLKVVQEGFARACFAAGTPLLVPGGVKAIEAFRVGDPILSRDEWDAGGEVGVQYVEEVFRRTGRLLNVHAGGQVIGTTAEHPFWVVGQGWTPALELRPGDHLVGHDGQRVAVGEVFDTGEVVPVYNLRVSAHHTYFVGRDEWGWTAWAHNTCLEAFAELAASPEMTAKRVTVEKLMARKAIKEIFSPAYKVKHTSLEDFKYKLEIELDRTGFLSTNEHLSAETLLIVKQAAAIPKRSTVRIDPSTGNPYAEGTVAHSVFQSQVLGDPVKRGYYTRILALEKWETKTLGTSTALELIKQLPGGVNHGRSKGLVYQLARTEAYKEAGILRAVEKSLGSGHGEVDILLTNDQLVDAKAWTQLWWDELSQLERERQIDDLSSQVTKYLAASSAYKLRLEFKYFVPPQVRSMIDEFVALPAYTGRIDAVVRS